MSENKRPYDDEHIDIDDLNDDLDKTKVFNIKSNNDDHYVSKHSSGVDYYDDDFSDNGELNSYSQVDRLNYKDDYNMGEVDEEPRPIVSRTNTYVGNGNGKKNNNKKTILIALIIAAVVLVVVAVVLVLNSCNKNNTDNLATSTTETSTTSVTTTLEVYKPDDETLEYTTEPTTEEITEPTTEETTEETTEPTTQATPSGNTVNATFAPYKCITPDGDVITDDFAKELHGDVSIALRSDGTFSLSMGNVASESGNYQIDGNALTLGSYDGNIMFDNAGNPIAITLYVDDYSIAFN